MTPAAWVALHARRYMETYGVDQRRLRQDRGRSTASTRRRTPTRGSTSGRSRSRTTRRRAGSSSRCCGCSTAARRATAASRSSSPVAERARDLRQPPAVITAAAQGADVRRRDDDELLPRRPHRAARDGRGRPTGSGATPASSPADISTAFLYDHFTPFVFDAARGARVLRARARPRTSRRSSGSRSAASCRSTPTAGCSARPTSTA